MGAWAYGIGDIWSGSTLGTLHPHNQFRRKSACYAISSFAACYFSILDSYNRLRPPLPPLQELPQRGLLGHQSAIERQVPLSHHGQQ